MEIYGDYWGGSLFLQQFLDLLGIFGLWEVPLILISVGKGKGCRFLKIIMRSKVMNTENFNAK